MMSKKIITLLVGICGVLSGILVIIFAAMDKPFPTPLWIVFSVLCILNGCMNYMNRTRK